MLSLSLQRCEVDLHHEHVGPVCKSACDQSSRDSKCDCLVNQMYVSVTAPLVLKSSICNEGSKVAS